jgi:radical SAM superfamily enzyme YgiQ (UPF0313 family)
VRVLLLSTYELGHQPLHVAAPAGTLLRAGHDVRCVDLSVQALDPESTGWAEAVAVSVPMHTAMRLARSVCARLRSERPDLPVCFYGLYAAVDDGGEHPSRADRAITGEYEPLLAEWLDELADRRPSARNGAVRVHLGRQDPSLPARHLLPPLEHYARLVLGEETRLAGYVEASHGCAHRCRHCPVPVVYDGRTRIVGPDAVVADVAQLVDLGARHVTFGDPDFLNGPHHARRVVDAVHGAFPSLTFDVTAKVEHVLAHRGLWAGLAEKGCLFVVSAFESASDTVLRRLDKGHTAADEVEAVQVLRGVGIEPRPSLLPFTPWTTADDVMALLDLVAHCDLIGNVDPVQYAIRLLVPPGSLLLDGDHLHGLLGPYDTEHLGWSWRSADPVLDELQVRLTSLSEAAGTAEWDPRRVYGEVRAAALELLGPGAGAAAAPAPDPALRSALAPEARPRLSESWFCCAEPTSTQMSSVHRELHAPHALAAAARPGPPPAHRPVTLTGGR